MFRLLLIIFSSVSFFTGSFAQHDPNFAPGRTTIVHLFEWKWNDIAEECERFLGPIGYGGVQVSPPNENAVITNPYRPWYERYQSVSYNLITRSGNENEFQSMVRRCNDVGVRIYVDTIINHMTGGYSWTGNTYGQYDPNRPYGVGVGTGGCVFNGPNKQYDCVPYTSMHFNNQTTCPTASGTIEDYGNRIQVKNCELVGLKDLNQGTPYVADKIVEFLNKLIGYGVAGFRVDAATHMWPEDMQSIFNRLDNLPTEHGFPAGAKPFVFQEVFDAGNAGINGSEYFSIGRVTEFNHGHFLGNMFRGNEQLKWLIGWGEEWGLYPSGQALVFINNHDNQRVHGGAGNTILTFRQARQLKMATAFMLAHPYGVTRVMSSFYWEQQFDENNDKDLNDWIGPPNMNGEIISVPINSDLTCDGGWVCEHRWRQIFNMVDFRNVVDGSELREFWSNDNNQITFCRGDKGFIAINNDDYPLAQTRQTCLPAGTYCDVISGSKVDGGGCSGTNITVAADGLANINLSDAAEDPVIAIHIGSKL